MGAPALLACQSQNGAKEAERGYTHELGGCGRG